MNTPSRKFLLLTLAALGSAQARTITDDLGRQVTIPDAPKRVAALSPFLVEGVFAVGVTPVARPSSATYPQAALKVPEVGLSYTPNLERLAATRPDVVFVSSLSQRQLIPSLEKLGIPVVAIGSSSVNDVYEMLQRFGTWLGQPGQAARAEKNLRAAVASARAKGGSRPLNVFTLVGTPQSFFGAKRESFTGNLIAALGARNVAKGPDDKRYVGFTPYSFERLLADNPDVIIVIKPTTNQQQQGSVLDDFRRNPLWQKLRAVQSGRVYEIAPEVVLSSPGPRAAEAIGELARFIYQK
ncbi:ABC transporter substrate-binding protein [Deinococcus sp. NW-56]|uniref:ABC transporter substrate-binding protein n=1 Tax=Deinococcus sp. NW-56 TaxID=2080419 RepID=UPI000CF481D9|nr:ABC transporter substrate-binding protein [Deinococcus sp. NW-56]